MLLKHLWTKSPIYIKPFNPLRQFHFEIHKSWLCYSLTARAAWQSYEVQSQGLKLLIRIQRISINLWRTKRHIPELKFTKKNIIRSPARSFCFEVLLTWFSWYNQARLAGVEQRSRRFQASWKPVSVCDCVCVRQGLPAETASLLTACLPRQSTAGVAIPRHTWPPSRQHLTQQRHIMYMQLCIIRFFSMPS